MTFIVGKRGCWGYWLLVIGYWRSGALGRPLGLGWGGWGGVWGVWGSYRKRYGGRKNLRAVSGIGRNLRRRDQFQEEEEREGKVER